MCLIKVFLIFRGFQIDFNFVGWKEIITFLDLRRKNVWLIKNLYWWLLIYFNFYLLPFNFCGLFLNIYWRFLFFFYMCTCWIFNLFKAYLIILLLNGWKTCNFFFLSLFRSIFTYVLTFIIWINLHNWIFILRITWFLWVLLHNTYGFFTFFLWNFKIWDRVDFFAKSADMVKLIGKSLIIPLFFYDSSLDRFKLFVEW